MGILFIFSIFPYQVTNKILYRKCHFATRKSPIFQYTENFGMGGMCEDVKNI